MLIKGLSWAVKYKIKVFADQQDLSLHSVSSALGPPTQFVRTSLVLVCGLSRQEAWKPSLTNAVWESEPLVLFSWSWSYSLGSSYSMWGFVVRLIKRGKRYFCTGTEPLQQFISFGISEQTRNRNLILLFCWARGSLVGFSWVHFGFLQQPESNSICFPVPHTILHCITLMSFPPTDTR